jgi:hypothetical protein
LASALLLLPFAEGRGFYYNSIAQEYQINSDKSVTVRVSFEVVNPEIGQSLTGISWTVPYTVTDVRAWDEQGGLSVSTEGRENQTAIKISFRSPIYRGQSLRFWLEYREEGIVHGVNSEFRGRFGAFQTEEREVRNYEVRVAGPPGSRLFLTSPSAEVEGESACLRTSLKERESFEGLPVVFYRTPIPYRVSLAETVSNKGTEESTVLLDILLFNLSQSQFAALYSSSHPIESIYVDEENNWHACFKLKLRAGATENVRLELLWICDIHSPGVGPENSGRLAEIGPALDPYLKGDTWWEVDNPNIQRTASLLAAGETNIYRLAENIIQGVGKMLEYRETELRQGALLTLQRGTGDCDGYSDLTIALSRACGLPARLCLGWVVKEEGSGGHAWVEFYTPSFGWQPADPTWAENWGDYLFRSDPVRLLRGVRGLSSSNSTVSISYFGPEPTLQESAVVSQLENQEVLPLLLHACNLALNMAGQLAKPENPTLREAQSLYELAKNEGSVDSALRSIRCSYQILLRMGRKPELKRELLPSWVLIFVLLAAGVLVTVVLLRKR